MNFGELGFVSSDVFHDRHRRSPLAEIFDWTDYRVGGMPPPLQPGFGPGGPWGRRRGQLGQLLIGIAVVLAVIYVVQRLLNPRHRNANWF